MKKFDIACIIEDNLGNIFWLETIMEDVNFCDHLIIFHNGKEALDQLKALIESGGRLPEIIFLDLNMPVMDGWEFLDEFTLIPTKKQILIYIVTSSIDPADIERTKEYEKISGYIVKPVTMDNLREILQAATLKDTIL